jgi:hypothetical protein
MKDERSEDSSGKRKPRRSRTTPIPKNMITACIDNAFDDKRVTIAYIAVWFIICLVGFTWLGIFGSEYMRVGPSPTLTYMGMLIDTMPRYLTVVGFVVISTAINDFASDAISPWIQNTVMDHKSRTIPYSKFTVLFISQTWSLYCGVMSVASIALVFAQFDLIMIRLVVDLFVNQYTIRRFLLKKSHDPFRYHNEFLNEEEVDSLAGEDDIAYGNDFDLTGNPINDGHGGSRDFVIGTDQELTQEKSFSKAPIAHLSPTISDDSHETFDQTLVVIDEDCDTPTPSKSKRSRTTRSK